jgi:hypothetical protein
MTSSKFTEFLKEAHAANEYMATDDDMSGAFESWLTNLQVDDLIALADKAIEMATISAASEPSASEPKES